MTIKKRINTRHHDKPAVTVYVTPNCVNCPKTLRTLRDHNISHTVVDVNKDNDARRYVTQVLRYLQAPIVEVKHGWDITTWSGHQPDLIDEHILAHYHKDTDEDRMAQAHANTTSVIRNSGLGRSTGPHLQIRANEEG